ncbi:hypothetical protein BDW02DRAFT_489801 [Decorospora gaudefroyi]|uniref:YjgF-like protein n=1 Tax=Decorospora gaudefroyi TaxID=184978 RepID=A0A6A5KRB2_9PLEO|nr:hypothetical protein BDW02DRAFT_489801 [Decorospora gaudefroyi]
MTREPSPPPFDFNTPSGVEHGKPHAFDPSTVVVDPSPIPSYRQVCVTPIKLSSKIITVAGQSGVQSDGTFPFDIRMQARYAHLSVHACLKAAGATLRDIIHVRHYIVIKTGNAIDDVTDIGGRGLTEVWRCFMDGEGGDHRPPSTVIGVASLSKEEMLYECEVMALVHA